MINIMFYMIKDWNMQYVLRLLVVLVGIASINGCKGPQSMFSQGISQGISGVVLWYEGDLMPGIDKPPVEGKPIKREIRIYEATTLKDAEVVDGQFYHSHFHIG